VATAVDTALTEVLAALDTLAPEVVGARALASLDQTLAPEARASDAELLGLLTRRQAKLEAARDALAALVSDGYPTVPLEDATAPVLAELDQAIAAMVAARTRFNPLGPPVAGTVTAAAPDLKA